MMRVRRIPEDLIGIFQTHNDVSGFSAYHFFLSEDFGGFRGQKFFFTLILFGRYRVTVYICT